MAWWRVIDSVRPGVEYRHARGHEILDVAGNHGHPVYQGRRGDQGVAYGTHIGDMQTCAGPCHGDVDREDAMEERRHDMVLEPGPQNPSLGGIPSLAAQDVDFEFLQDDDGDEQFGRFHLPGPCTDTPIGLARLYLAQLRDDIGIQQVHQLKSASRAGSRIGVTSSSTSSEPGMASRVAMLSCCPVRRRYSSMVN